MDLLVLLVGSNPLPIYVTARYLLSGETSDDVPRPNALLLLYSNDTKMYAQAIRQQLGPLLEAGAAADEVSVGDDQRNFERLHRIIAEELAHLTTRPAAYRSVHLNITGGTKPMAVASYEAVCAFVDSYRAANGPETSPRLLISDLDPDHHQLRVYERRLCTGAAVSHLEQVVILPPAGDLRRGITLSPANLASLHLLTIENPGTSNLTVGELINVEDFAREALRDTEDRKESALLAFQAAVREEGSEVKRLTQRLDKRSKCDAMMSALADTSSPATPLLSRLRDAYPSLAPFFSEDRYAGLWLFRPEQKDSLCSLVDFVKGKWLEEYALSVMHGALAAFGSRRGIGVSACMGLVVSHGQRQRELDVYGVCGYSTVLVSCTTESQAGLVKLKAFEAFQRARELGGDHAETVVLSLLPDTSTVRDDMTSFDAVQHVHILGRQDVQDELEGRGTITREIRRIMEG